MTQLTLPEMGPEFAGLVFLALDHGVESVRDIGVPLNPFVICLQEGKRRLHRVDGEELADCVRRTREVIAGFGNEVTAYAFVLDAFLTVEGERFDAVMVEASERNRPAGIRLAQRYRPKKFLRAFQRIGNPLLIGECETLLR